MSTIYRVNLQLAMDKLRINHHFYLALLEFLMSAKQHIIAISGEFGLTSIQAMTLLLLDANEPRPMKNFCQLYHCDASNITGIIDGLEKKGLVSRQNDAHDRRIKVIQLEPTGKKMQQAIIEQLDADSGFLFEPLTDNETRQFACIVEKLGTTRTTAA